MRVVVCDEVGSLDRLRIEERDSPALGPGQVRIAVGACGLNFVDALLVQGLYQIKPPVPFVPGSELAGTVSEVAEGVTEVDIGNRVFATVGLGGFCDEAVLAADQVVAVPPNLDLPRAASMVQSYCTAWFALRRRAQLEAGDWVLVLGAAGGVGLAAVDVAAAAGAHVIAAASSPEKLAVCRDAGAEATIDYSAEPLKERARELSGGRLAVTYDPVGGELSEAALRALDDNGQLLVIGFASGDIPALPANQVLLRNRRVIGVDWGGWAMAHAGENAAMFAEVLDAVAEGVLHPPVPTAYPFHAVGEALADLVGRRLIGKAVLIPGEGPS